VTEPSQEPGANDAEVTTTNEQTENPGETRRRTSRSRSRGRAADAAKGADDGGGRSRGGGATGSQSDEASDDEASGRKRRRRRGGRGRGRGRRGDGGQGSADAVETAASAGGDPDEGTRSDGEAGGSTSDGEGRQDGGTSQGDPKDDRKGDTDGTDVARGGGSATAKGGGNGKGGGSAKAKDGGNGKGGGSAKAKDGGKGNGQDGGNDKDTSDVEEAIAKGGTRMAAKRGRNDGGGGGRRKPPRPGGVPEEVRRAILDGPPRTMLVTAGEDRTQIAVLEDRSVVEHYVTRKEDVTYVGNIYMARVQNVLPGMEAAFLDIGKGRNGVLYAGEVLFDELDLEEGADERIENVLKTGQKVLVQVTKDPMGTKGPRLTMHLSLAGRYLVLAPDSDLFGISRKLTDKERDRLRNIVKRVKPDPHGVIVRTAAEGATEEQITADMERLLAKWAKVQDAAEEAKALTAVYEEPPLVVKVIRDNFGPEFERCVVDDESLYHQVRGYLEEVAPELLDKVELYGQPTADARARAAGAPPLEIAPTNGGPAGGGEGDGGKDGADGDAAGAGTDGGRRGEAVPEGASAAVAVDLTAAAERRAELPPLFEAYDVTDQLRKAMGRKVWLPSGGYLIIEPTEAMKVIDVNTGKFTGGSDTNLEEVVLKTNLEAADEIVRQLRLRDMGGIIVIDFIDMLLKANQDQVVRRLKRELLRDRTKTRVSEVSRLGLVQMTRKNVSQGLLESFSHTCEACEGRGVISELD
jgi:Ribonuclease G/E